LLHKQNNKQKTITNQYREQKQTNKQTKQANEHKQKAKHNIKDDTQYSAHTQRDPALVEPKVFKTMR